MASEYDLTPGISWPTILYRCKWREHNSEAPGIIEHLYQIRARYTQNIASEVARSAKSSYGLFESPFDLLETDHAGLKKLRAFIEEALQLAVSHVNGAQVPPERIQPIIVDSWFHITNDGGYHDAHFHAHCSWCGIYYLQAGDSTAVPDQGAGNGVNRFYSPLTFAGAFSDYGNHYLSSNRIDIVPEDGVLILFPAYLLHSALPYRGRKDRIVISFNSQSVLRESDGVA